MIFGPHTVTRLRATAVIDPYSGEETDLSWDDPDRLDISGCSVQPPTGAAILADRRQGVIYDYSAWMPLDADVTELDRIQYAGKVFTIPDTIQRWDFPGLGHLVVPMQRVEG